MPIAAESRKGQGSSRSKPESAGGLLTLPGQEVDTLEESVSDEQAKHSIDALNMPGQPDLTLPQNSEDVTRFFGAFQSIFGQAVNTLLPQVFSLLRAEAQTRSDGQANQADVDRSLADFLSLLQPVVNQLVPLLIEEINKEQQTRSAQSLPEDMDQEGQDRFWGTLISAAIPVVIDNMPGIIDEVGSAFSPGGVLGGLFGGRSYTRSVSRDEIQVPVADREMVARFWGPLLNIVGGALSACLPELFKVVQGRGVSRDYTISWGDLSVTNRLWDNDVIGVVAIGDAVDPNNIELVLELAWPKTWWKGIQVQDDNGSYITEVGVQDNTRINETSVPGDFILNGGYLLFMKAKMFGIHTGMYRMSTARMEELRGRRIHFLWAAD